jgi:hypothetical protein
VKSRLLLDVAVRESNARPELSRQRSNAADPGKFPFLVLESGLHVHEIPKWAPHQEDSPVRV